MKQRLKTFSALPGNITLRTVTDILLVLALAISFIMAWPAPSHALSVKSTSVVEGEGLYLSDLFDGVAPDQDIRLGRAPHPGDQLEISSSVLARIAKVYNLSWRPESMSQSVVVRRSAGIISSESITQDLREKLIETGVDGQFHITYSGDQPNIILPERLPKTFEISAFSFDPSSDRFQASLVAPSKDRIHKTLDVFGKIDRMVQIPVLKASMRNGSIIDASDIDMVDVRIRTLGDDVIIDPKKVIGMTPDRFLVSQKPIRKNDIRPPMMVARGERITLVHHEGILQLTAVGKSMEDGSVGDIIRVVNIDSNKNLRAEVIGDGIVRVE